MRLASELKEDWRDQYQVAELSVEIAERAVELEWRGLLTQPWRWRRQLALPRFLALAAGRALGSLRTGVRGGSRLA